MKSIKLMAISASVLLLLGCSNSMVNTVNNTNEKFLIEQYPYRYILSEKAETHTSYTLEPAGSESETIAKYSEVLLTDIFRVFKNECGFSRSDLVGVNKVDYTPPVFYEVWTFKDLQSERADKTSSMSVILKAYANGGGTDISYVGSCHAKPAKLVFSN
ncbi:hypothetical protein FHO46_17630 [Vibrio cholerae]|uniref:hypothetical protein n=1 Tax=Vibrio cholerae TaxID=666 RepID=UPI0011D6C08E|nr:hypothetical protein [Vibrio cholerae]EGR0366545.1 hypothetical protein [Vibrio cholerae]TXY89411.1 hypothetical protein FXE72_12580 [Vibrio cholerae]GIA68457.1 Hypothetical protein VCSRO88_0823 [Vibrio cholerae]